MPSPPAVRASRRARGSGPRSGCPATAGSATVCSEEGDGRQGRVGAGVPRRDVLGEGAITRLSGSSTLAAPVTSWIPTGMPETEPSSTHQACSQSFWAMPTGPAQYPETPPAPEHEHRPRATRGTGSFRALEPVMPEGSLERPRSVVLTGPGSPRSGPSSRELYSKSLRDRQRPSNPTGCPSQRGLSEIL